MSFSSSVVRFFVFFFPAAVDAVDAVDAYSFQALK